MRRTRSEIVRENDEALRDALTETILETGWDSVTFSGVAKRAGLTVGAVYGRAENTSELGIDLWENRVDAWLASSIDGILDAAEAGDEVGLRRLMKQWDTSTDETGVAIELLVAALFDADLAEVIEACVRKILGARCVPSRDVTASAAASNTLEASFIFGRAIAICAGTKPDPITKHQISVLAGHHSGKTRRKINVRPQELKWERDNVDVNAQEERILRAVLNVIGRVGYKRATVARIARTAGVTRGAVMSHYKDKNQLIAKAVDAYLIPPGEVWSQYADVEAKHGPLISRAIFLEDFLKPSNLEMWKLNLELSRVSRYVPELAEFKVPHTTLEHTHLGVMLVAAYVPGLVNLPYLDPFMAGSAT